MVAVDHLIPTAPAQPGPPHARPAEPGADFAQILRQTAAEPVAPPEERAPQEEAREPAAAPESQESVETEADQAAPQEGEERQEGKRHPADPHHAAPATGQEMAAGVVPLPGQQVQPFLPLPEGVAGAALAQGEVLAPPLPAGASAAPVPEKDAPLSAVLPLPQELPEPAEAKGLETLETAEGQALPPDQAAGHPASLVPAEAGKGHSSFDLLRFDEWMRPDLKVDPAPDGLLDQLQQAMDAALLDETVVVPQVVRGLATLAGGGLAEMRLQLQPEDLGEIELRVRTSEGVVRGEMLVQHAQVKHLLDAQVDRLRAALTQQGLELAGFDIGLSPDGRQPGHAWRRPESGQRFSGLSQGPAVEIQEPAGASRSGHAVDYLV